MTKFCRACGLDKQVSLFSFITARKSYHTYCRECVNLKNKASYYKWGGVIHKKKPTAEQKERQKIQQKIYYKNNPDKFKVYYLRKKEKYKGISQTNYMKLYGITHQDYANMLSNQGGTCRVCRNADCTGKRLAVDHCHITGKVRGLLCGRCNKGLGLFKDSKELVSTLLEYLYESN